MTGFSSMQMERFIRFVIERWTIMMLKEQGAPKPWTEDVYLRAYRFCNVRREDDLTTRWIREHWLPPESNGQYLWFISAVARLLNWPAALTELGLPMPWDRNHFLAVLRVRTLRREKIFSAAYLVNQRGGDGQPKYVYVADQVLQPLWDDRIAIEQMARMDTLRDLWACLLSYRGIGNFMAAQIVADVKYCGTYRLAPDWHTFAASGPGSRRGLERITGAAYSDEDEWHAMLLRVRESLNWRLAAHGIPALHAQDVQNCLCEFDKYERVRLGEGTPRTTYAGV